MICFWLIIAALCSPGQPSSSQKNYRHSNRQSGGQPIHLQSASKGFRHNECRSSCQLRKAESEDSSLEKKKKASVTCADSSSPAQHFQKQSHEHRVQVKLPPIPGSEIRDASKEDDDGSTLGSLLDLSRTSEGSNFASSWQRRSEVISQPLGSSCPLGIGEHNGRQKVAALARRGKSFLTADQQQNGSMSSPKESQGQFPGNQAKLRLPVGSESCMQYTLDLQKRVHKAVFSGNLHHSGGHASLSHMCSCFSACFFDRCAPITSKSKAT